MPNVQHGTVNMYQNGKCRCEECRVATSEYRRALRAAKPEQVKKWHATAKAKGVKYETKRHGMTKQERLELLASQDNKCAACSEPLDIKYAVIDHDHSHCPGPSGCSECVRGYICRSCNLALGWVEDSTDRLSALIVYLNRRK